MQADSTQENTGTFSSRHLTLLHTHNALGLGLHRQPSYNHYISSIIIKVTQRFNIFICCSKRVRAFDNKKYADKLHSIQALINGICFQSS